MFVLNGKRTSLLDEWDGGSLPITDWEVEIVHIGGHIEGGGTNATDVCGTSGRASDVTDGPGYVKDVLNYVVRAALVGCKAEQVTAWHGASWALTPADWSHTSCTFWTWVEAEIILFYFSFITDQGSLIISHISKLFA